MQRTALPALSLAICLALLAAPPALGASTTYGYAVGGGADTPLFKGILFCANVDGAPRVGGACGIPLNGAPRIALEVADDAGAPVAFEWAAYDADQRVCASGSGVGNATATLPANCATLTVAPSLGSLAGTISLTELHAE